MLPESQKCPPGVQQSKTATISETVSQEPTNGASFPEEPSTQWKVEPSLSAQATINPIRRILVEWMKIKINPSKPLIPLHIGDPTISQILPPHAALAEAVKDSVDSGVANGYGPAFGIERVRSALADHITHADAKVTADDIILTSGCSQALHLAIEVLANPGSNVLIPAPGFSLYQTLISPLNAEARTYQLLPEKFWDVDLEDLESKIDRNTVAILVNNPSNPAGSVYSRQHLEAILSIAEKFKVPIIADEVYGDLVFGDAKFYPLSRLSRNVPVLTCDGISKRYLVPGWRLGWLVFHDPLGILARVRDCARSLSQRIVGPCVLIQTALPSILMNTPEEFFDHTRQVLAENSDLIMKELSSVPGILPIQPHGAMYLMVKLDLTSFVGFDSDLQFCRKLLQEESVFCLPGSIFLYPGSFRMVTTFPKEKLTEACIRIKGFCQKYRK